MPDQGNSRVQKFTRDGKFVGKWGELGKEPGQFGGGQGAGGRFAGPQFVAFDRAGNVYTTDAALDRVQKFTSDGKLLAFWGSESAEPGGFCPLASHTAQIFARVRELLDVVVGGTDPDSVLPVHAQ